MSNKIFLPAMALLVALGGCASHEPISTPALVQGSAVNGLSVKADGVELITRPIVSIADNKTYFDDDLLQYNVLAVQTLVENDDYDGTLTLETASFALINPAGDAHPAMSADAIVEKAKKSFGRALGWGVAFGLLGAIPSAINVSNTNDRIQADYKARILKDATLPKDGRTEGTAFFSMPVTTRSLDGWLLRIILKDAVSTVPLTLEQPLSGVVEERTTPQNS